MSQAMVAIILVGVVTRGTLSQWEAVVVDGATTLEAAEVGTEAVDGVAATAEVVEAVTSRATVVDPCAVAIPQVVPVEGQRPMVAEEVEEVIVVEAVAILADMEEGVEKGMEAEDTNGCNSMPILKRFI